MEVLEFICWILTNVFDLFHNDIISLKRYVSKLFVHNNPYSLPLRQIIIPVYTLFYCYNTYNKNDN